MVVRHPNEKKREDESKAGVPQPVSTQVLSSQSISYPKKEIKSCNSQNKTIKIIGYNARGLRNREAINLYTLKSQILEKAK